MKKLIHITHRRDFGHDIYVQLLNIRKWSLLQFSISWNDDPCFPYLQITSGANGLLGFMFWVYKFGVDFDVISRTYNFNYLDMDTL